MQVQQIDAVGVQSLQAFFTLAAESFRAASSTRSAGWIPMHAAFGGDDDLVALAGERFGQQPFAFAVGAVAVGGVEKVDAGHPLPRR